MLIYVIGGGDNPAPVPDAVDPGSKYLRRRSLVLPGHSVYVKTREMEIVFDACSPDALSAATGKPVLFLSSRKREHRRYEYLAGRVYGPGDDVPEKIGDAVIRILRGYGVDEAYAYHVSAGNSSILYVSDATYFIDELPRRPTVLVVDGGCGLNVPKACEEHYTIAEVLSLVHMVKPRTTFITHYVPETSPKILNEFLKSLGYDSVFIVTEPILFNTDTGEVIEYVRKPLPRRL